MNKVTRSEKMLQVTIEVGQLTKVHFRITENLLDNEKSCVLHGSVHYSAYTLADGITFKAITPSELRAYIEGLKIVLANYESAYNKYFNNDEIDDD